MLTKYLDPTVKVLYTFTEVLGGVLASYASSLFSVTICTLMFIYLAGFLTCESDLCGVGVLLSAVRDVRASHSLSLTSSSAWNASFCVSKPTSRCNRPPK
ncbi:hypothetical protein BGY98DRAFT_146138 [Russula aff. rugulosa BPL654]|nr:hypothetical protein BGY98DRAFT_146138 [Russula aff. rugulosa BPL654]